MTSAASMDISESFRPEDLSKTDFFDFVTAPPDQENNEVSQNTNNHQPLQGFDQFWGAEKEERLETAIFEDINRYCWNQQNGANLSISTSNTNISTTNPTSSHVESSDGQIYTITVLNSSTGDQWLRKDNSEQTTGLDINLDTILSSYPFIKTECFSYDEGNFAPAQSIKEENGYQLATAPQIVQPKSSGVTSTNVASGDLTAYADMTNNNNEWNANQNEIKTWETSEANESSESLLRSALQGKSGYGKIGLQSGITVIPVQNSIKDELRCDLFANDQESITFADSTLSSSLFNDSQNHQSTLSQHASGAVDDMFLTLDNAFTDDFEKMKRFANEVHQLCAIDSRGSSFSEVMTVENKPVDTSAILRDETTLSPKINNMARINKNRLNGTKMTKKYKKNTNNNNNNANDLTNNNDINTINNNIQASSNTTPPCNSAAAILTSINGLSSGTVCNSIRKERSLHYCSICSKGFKDKYSVNVHIRTHTGEKPFSCGICGKSFRQKAHLAKHYQTHLQKSTNGSIKSKHQQKHTVASSHAVQT